jgi:hypothetical protein
MKKKEAQMRLVHSGMAVIVGAALSLFAAGCKPSAPPAAPASGEAAGDAHEGGGHEGHSHAAHGPHGGHIIELGDEEYHAEWTHDDDGKVTVYLLDHDMKEEVPIEAKEITIEVKVGDAPSTFKLLAVQASDGDMPKSAKFEIVDKGLLGVLESLSKGVTARLKIPAINGKRYEAAILPDDHHH